MNRQFIPTPLTARMLSLPQPILHAVIAHVLTGAVRENDKLPTRGTVTRFHAKEVPPLEIGAYLTRLCVYTPHPRDAVVLSLLYLDRISRLVDPLLPDLDTTPLFPSIARAPVAAPPSTAPVHAHRPGTPLSPPLGTPTKNNSHAPHTPNSRLGDPLAASSPHRPEGPRPPSPPPLLNSFTLHRLLAATLLVASKFTSDGYIAQARASKVAGVDRAELTRLEVEILKALNWTLGYSIADIEDVAKRVLAVGEECGLVEPVAVKEEETTVEGEAEKEGVIAGGGGLRASSSETSFSSSTSTALATPLASPPRVFTPTPPSSPPSSSASASTAGSSTAAEEEEGEGKEEERTKTEGPGEELKARRPDSVDTLRTATRSLSLSSGGEAAGGGADDKDVAVVEKFLLIQLQALDARDRHHTLDQAAIMSNVQEHDYEAHESHHVVACVNTSGNEYGSWIIMEMCAGSDLLSYQLSMHMHGMRISEGDIEEIALQVFEGLLHLHSNHISHGDMKSDNILISEVSTLSQGGSSSTHQLTSLFRRPSPSHSPRGQLKITDFGFARDLRYQQSPSTGNPALMNGFSSPEFFPAYWSLRKLGEDVGMGHFWGGFNDAAQSPPAAEALLRQVEYYLRPRSNIITNPMLDSIRVSLPGVVNSEQGFTAGTKDHYYTEYKKNGGKRNRQDYFKSGIWKVLELVVRFKYEERADAATVVQLLSIFHLEKVPETGRWRFMDVSPAMEQQMGEQGFAEVMQQYRGKLLPDNHPLARQVQRVAHRIVDASGLREGGQWDVHVVADGETRNAFVLPGGRIFVFTGILPITKSDDGLAVVLGHEIAHQVARHSAERMSSLKVLFVLSLVLQSTGLDPGQSWFQPTSADPCADSELVTFCEKGLSRVLLELLMSLPNSRKNETEADFIGLQLATKACFDPRAGTGVWQRMESSEGSSGKKGNVNLDFLSTHPSSARRVEKVTEWATEMVERRPYECGPLKARVEEFGRATRRWT
ncbi:mitochondrial inner membrane metallopeptidase Oma1 [Pseudohyphozyma bogoriensis]|nr:mitochondrial inner membrane metallopeptidase Oma1 [Pseudohyphozyma bogoriensis]